MENNQMEIDEDLVRWLHIGGHAKLADCLSDVPDDNKTAIYNMISNMEYRRLKKHVIAYQVCEDIGEILSGKSPIFSKDFMV